MANDNTRGENLCKSHGLQFADVFIQQFRISRRGTRPLPGFKAFCLRNWSIEVGKGLPIITNESPNHGASVALFGIAVDQTGAVVNQELLEQKSTPEDLIAYLNACGGRFAFLIITDGFTKFYGDASGNLGALYDPDAGVIASTLNLVLSRNILPNDSYPLSELASLRKARFAFGHTYDRYVKRLLPNHSLDLSDFSASRFWPGINEISETQRSTEQTNVDYIIGRLNQIVESLATAYPNTRLPISGGLDSRVLLAVSQSSLSKISLFSHAENMMSRKDTRIASRLATILGQHIDVYDPMNNMALQLKNPDTLMVLSNANHIAVGEGQIGTALSKTGVEVLHAVPAGGLVLRGNLVDFLKAVLWRRGVAEYTQGRKHDIELGLRMMMLSDRQTMKELPVQSTSVLLREYEEWFASLSAMAAKRPFDMMFLEQFLPHGAGNQFYGFTRNFYICPFNERSLLSAAISLPPDRRAALHYTENIIATWAPNLQQVKYARKGTDQYIKEKQRKRLDWYLQ